MDTPTDETDGPQPAQRSWRDVVADVIELRGLCDALDDGPEWFKRLGQTDDELNFPSIEARHEAFSTCRSLFTPALNKAFECPYERGLNELIGHFNSPERLAEQKTKWQSVLRSQDGIAKANELLERTLDNISFVMSFYGGQPRPAPGSGLGRYNLAGIELFIEPLWYRGNNN